MFAILHTLPAHFSSRSLVQRILCAIEPTSPTELTSVELCLPKASESIPQEPLRALRPMIVVHSMLVALQEGRRAGPPRKGVRRLATNQSIFVFFVAEVGNHGLGRTLSELKDLIFQSGCDIFV